ncbi:hypothetical protein MACH26_22260 [Planctobacterium marinum]|uniref:Uncharacterized protein n=1 Tax=Planctobacterium marinum TaxID=1631968 RepID=A0AA48I6A4_9ALTE|nr:hypothetical protein MACH26_22260 [Planctobacterium marinum]
MFYADFTGGIIQNQNDNFLPDWKEARFILTEPFALIANKLIANNLSATLSNYQKSRHIVYFVNDEQPVY